MFISLNDNTYPVVSVCKQWVKAPLLCIRIDGDGMHVAVFS